MTTTLNATLTRTSAALARVAVIATRCATCGTAGVYVGSTLVAKIGLYASTHPAEGDPRPARVLAAFGDVTLKALTSGKRIEIDASASAASDVCRCDLLPGGTTRAFLGAGPGPNRVIMTTCVVT